MEAATENKRGRPRIYGEMLYAIYSDKEKRVAQNSYYAGIAIQLMQQQPGDFFVTEKGNFRRKGIAEQIGRMSADGYTEADCKKVAEMAIDLYKRGLTTKAIERWIREGRTTNEW